jgi:hypothetical protein
VTGGGNGGTGLHLYSVQLSHAAMYRGVQQKGHVNSHPVNVCLHTVVPFLSPQLRGTWHGAGVGWAVHTPLQADFVGKWPLWSSLQVPVRGSHRYLHPSRHRESHVQL